MLPLPTASLLLLGRKREKKPLRFFLPLPPEETLLVLSLRERLPFILLTLPVSLLLPPPPSLLLPSLLLSSFSFSPFSSSSTIRAFDTPAGDTSTLPLDCVIHTPK
jgi:hypothetical protein